MFDVSLGEMAVIGAVALVVIGPEKLPKVARTLGVMVGRLQRYVANVKADISREVELDHLRKIEAEMNEAGRRLGAELSGQGQQIGSELQQTGTAAAEALSEPLNQVPTHSASEVKPVADDGQYDLFADQDLPTREPDRR